MRTAAIARAVALARPLKVYGTEAEAIRQAKQQAMRWVHDRTGDGQAQL